MTRLSPQRLTPIAAAVIVAVLLVSAILIILDYRRQNEADSFVGGPFALTDDEGRSVTDADYRGRPTLMFFGYTHCPDVCPTTLFELSEVLRKLRAGSEAGALFVTVDPERDTADVLKDYLSSFDRRIIGLTGARWEIDPVLREFRVYSHKIPGDDGDYTMDHSTIVYLMNRDMKFVAPLDMADQSRAIAQIEDQM